MHTGNLSWPLITSFRREPTRALATPRCRMILVQAA
ncbi:hypothetical protein CGRA01v4_02104 [Colletotrichum graminicola]|nr:hypothetical protein CGRA01v4_02104 [Colletotrichum graminicola]